MGTFTTKSIVDELIANDGLVGEEAPDNRRAIRIVEYDTPEGQTCWGVVFETERDVYRYDRETQYVRRPRLVFAYTELGGLV